MSNKIPNAKRVLIVDDNRELRRLYRSAFEKSGYQVAVSAEGEDGIKNALSFLPDVVLLDILMPNIDGYEMLQALRNNKMEMLIVILSNLADRESIRRAMESGANKFYCKIDHSPRQMVKEIDALLKK